MGFLGFCVPYITAALPPRGKKLLRAADFRRPHDEAKRMSEKKMVILDGNEAAASVAYRLSEVVAIYP
ncbi:MAG: hypothetical protein ABSE87_15230, partial [Terracidiphilus sp.]